MSEKTETKHTAGRLSVDPRYPTMVTADNDGLVVADFDVRDRKDDGNEANAARIVLTWNSHDALVEALRQIEGGCFEGSTHLVPDHDGALFVSNLQRIARAALAVAEAV